MSETIIRNAEMRMKKAVESTANNFARVQTGRASPSLLDGVFVEYYGTKNPINQVATITAPEPRVIMIQPWDKTVSKEIEKAISRSDLGLNPNSDGNVIRIQVPELTTERRKELAKYVSKLAEDGRIAIRNIRRDANDAIKKLDKSDATSKGRKGKERGGEKRKGDDDPVQKITDKYIDQISQLLKSKEVELMEL
ncbi:MAG: ribosome recycling factor [Candidatus Poribacteria bacterium]|nr:ribosome recycling factor [Candidatus Poribacteria bacterium]